MTKLILLKTIIKQLKSFFQLIVMIIITCIPISMVYVKNFYSNPINIVTFYLISI